MEGKTRDILFVLNSIRVYLVCVCGPAKGRERIHLFLILYFPIALLSYSGLVIQTASLQLTIKPYRKAAAYKRPAETSQ